MTLSKTEIRKAGIKNIATSRRNSNHRTHSFGGSWTKEKLHILSSYLAAYSTIFARNKNAQFFDTFYVDAFAGSGYIKTANEPVVEEPQLFENLAEDEPQEFLKGSAVCALEVDPPFKNYLFIERSNRWCEDLECLKQKFPHRAASIQIRKGDAKANLLSWVRSQNWNKTRAVVFLDPYGMQVDWEIIEALGHTQGIDLWLLFPLGVGVMRLLTREAPPPPAWSDALTRIFGSDTWKTEFYKSSPQTELFGYFAPTETREIDHTVVTKYITARLNEAFYAVHQEPLVLKNSRNNPLYLLCFASGNQKGSSTAMRIANYLIKS